MSILRLSWARVLQLSQTKRNVVANLFGNGWAALIQLLVIPVYISLLGNQAYGLYAFYFTISGFLQYFDFGFSPTINRELARYSVATNKGNETVVLTRTMEAIYIALGIALGICLIGASPFLANYWLKTSIDTSTVQTALVLMAILVVMQWPLSFYQGGINGLQKQTKLVTLQVAISTLKHGMGILLLILYPNILLLFGWFILITAVQSLLSALLLWKYLPAPWLSTRPSFVSIKPVRKFAIGSALTSFASIPLIMATPILLSGSVPLSEYGYYNIAATYGGIIAMLYLPIFTAIYPRLTTLIEERKPDLALNFYYLFGQFMALIIVPVGCALAFYSQDLLFIWQRNMTRADLIAPVAAILVVVNVVTGLAHLPYAWQLAHGITKINLAITLLLGLTQIPFLYFAIDAYGVYGAAFVSFATYLLLLILGLVFANRLVMHFGLVKWFIHNLLLPISIAIISFSLTKFYVHPTGTVQILIHIAITTIIVLMLSAFCMNMTRGLILNKFKSLRV